MFIINNFSHYQFPLQVSLKSQLYTEPLIWELLSSLKWKLWLDVLNITLGYECCKKYSKLWRNIFLINKS